MNSVALLKRGAVVFDSWQKGISAVCCFFGIMILSPFSLHKSGRNLMVVLSNRCCFLAFVKGMKYLEFVFG